MIVRAASGRNAVFSVGKLLANTNKPCHSGATLSAVEVLAFANTADRAGLGRKWITD